MSTPGGQDQASEPQGRPAPTYAELEAAALNALVDMMLAQGRSALAAADSATEVLAAATESDTPATEPATVAAEASNGATEAPTTAATPDKPTGAD